MKKNILTTQRFTLKELFIEDASNTYLHWLDDPKTSKYITHSHKQIKQLEVYIKDKQEDPNCLFWGIYYQNYHIGNIKYERLTDNKNVATMGILIGDDNWRGKGVAAEVINASIVYLKEKFNITHVKLGVGIDNTAAIKAYEKIGFTITENGYFNFPKTSLEMIYKI
jgi:RimJ/RimL family protein N-acetyltransferase